MTKAAASLVELWGAYAATPRAKLAECPFGRLGEGRIVRVGEGGLEHDREVRRMLSGELHGSDAELEERRTCLAEYDEAVSHAT